MKTEVHTSIGYDGYAMISEECPFDDIGANMSARARCGPTQNSVGVSRMLNGAAAAANHVSYAETDTRERWHTLASSPSQEMPTKKQRMVYNYSQTHVGVNHEDLESQAFGGWQFSDLYQTHYY